MCTKFGLYWLRNVRQKSKMAATKFNFLTVQYQTAVKLGGPQLFFFSNFSWYRVPNWVGGPFYFTNSVSAYFWLWVSTQTFFNKSIQKIFLLIWLNTSADANFKIEILSPKEFYEKNRSLFPNITCAFFYVRQLCS